MPRTKTTFPVDGRVYSFNKEKVVDMYSHDMHIHSGTKKKSIVIDKIAENANVSPNTVKDWFNSKKNGPSDISGVKAIAKFYGCDFMELLVLEENKEVKMENISLDEVNTARLVYGEMCDLLQFIDWTDPMEEGEVIRGENYGRFRNQEEAREHYYLVIKKASFDLSDEMCKALRELVDEVFGPFDIDNNYMFFNLDEYKDYLDKNKWENCSGAKYKYTVVFKQRMTEKIDNTFKPYMRRS